MWGGGMGGADREGHAPAGHAPSALAQALLSSEVLPAAKAYHLGTRLCPAGPAVGRFWHTLDGGDTWVLEAIKGLYIFSFDLVSKESGYAVALTAQSGVQLLKYRDVAENATMQLEIAE